MENSTGKTFLLTLSVVAVLLLMGLLPTFSIGDFESRPVEMLADIKEAAPSNLPPLGEASGAAVSPLGGTEGGAPYYQVFAHKHGFLPHLSILDLLFNMGPEGVFWL